MTLCVGLIGPGRTNHGTGPFVARFLAAAGASIVATAASTPERARVAARGLTTTTGVECRPYASASQMIALAQLDAVAICSPAASHAALVGQAIEHGRHVFCEKPLVAPLDGAGRQRALDLVARSARAGVVLHLNTQWVYTLVDFEALHGEIGAAAHLRVELAPPVTGSRMLEESVTHANSLLVAVGGGPPTSAVDAHWLHAGDVTVRFEANAPLRSTIGVEYRFRHGRTQPRSAAYEINGRRVERRVDTVDGRYEISLTDGRRVVRIVDPLRRSVDDFVSKTKSSTPNSLRTSMRDVVELDAVVFEGTRLPDRRSHGRPDP